MSEVSSPRPPCRRCPGKDGRKCVIFMSPVATDPHPLCRKCRGQTCSRDVTCDVCRDWSEDQWRTFEARKAYKKRPKPVKAHSLSASSIDSPTGSGSQPGPSTPILPADW